MDRPVIPENSADIDADWIMSALAHAGHDARVEAVRVTPIGTGQMASSLRVDIDYASHHDTAPASVVVKLASTDPNSREAGAAGAYLKEVRFYQQIRGGIEACTPRALWADVDETTHAFVLVLDDLRPAVQGDQIKGCTPVDALAAATNIAGLHAPRWRDPTLFDLSWLTVPAPDRNASYALAATVVEALTAGFIDRYRDRITDGHVGLLEWFSANVQVWLAHKPHAFGLTHGDHRLDNLMFDGATKERPVTVVDWQTLGVRNPVADVSYLLGTGLDPQVRREVEAEIVAAYHDRLVALGVAGYAYDECFDDYRTQSLHALLITVLGSMMTGRTDRGDDMFMAMLHRSAAQIGDLDATGTFL